MRLLRVVSYSSGQSVGRSDTGGEQSSHDSWRTASPPRMVHPRINRAAREREDAKSQRRNAGKKEGAPKKKDS